MNIRTACSLSTLPTMWFRICSYTSKYHK